MVASHVPPTGDLACNPGMCPDRESNQQPFDLQPSLNPLSHTSQGKHKTFCQIDLMVNTNQLPGEAQTEQIKQKNPPPKI